MAGLVHKSKGFLPMNLSNPKGEFFDAEGTGCVRGGGGGGGGGTDQKL